MSLQLGALPARETIERIVFGNGGYLTPEMSKLPALAHLEVHFADMMDSCRIMRLASSCLLQSLRIGASDDEALVAAMSLLNTGLSLDVAVPRRPLQVLEIVGDFTRPDLKAALGPLQRVCIARGIHLEAINESHGY